MTNEAPRRVHCHKPCCLIRRHRGLNLRTHRALVRESTTKTELAGKAAPAGFARRFGLARQFAELPGNSFRRRRVGRGGEPRRKHHQ
jgi:hypothetical protein